MAKTETKETEVQVPPARPAPILTGPLSALPKPSFKKDTVPFEKFQHVKTPEEDLGIRDGFDDSIFEWRYFNANQLNGEDGGPPLNGSMECGYWIPVYKTLDYLDYNMGTQVFVDENDPRCPWDADGFISKGGFLVTGNKRECREKYLCVRPMQVRQAEQAYRAELGKKILAATTPEKLAQMAKNKEGAALGGLHQANPNDPSNPFVQVVPSEKVLTSPSGWNQLGGS